MNKTKIFITTLFVLGLCITPQRIFAIAPVQLFDDSEATTNNQAITSTLDFAVRDNATSAVYDPTSPLFFKTEMLPGDTIVVPLDITKEGSADFKYQIQKEYLIPSTNLCDGLTMEAKLEGTVVYSSALNTFVLPSAVTHSGTIDHWILTLGLPTDSADYRSKTCMFGVNFKAWQTDSDGTWGFTSEKKFSLNVIESANWPMPGDLVINELMWMGSIVSGVSQTRDEWIELRNTTTSEIDLSGLELKRFGESDDSIFIPVGQSIPGSGYYLIAHYANTDVNSSLAVVADLVNANINLRNGGEQIELINNFGTILDKTPLPPTTTSGWVYGVNDGIVSKKSMERGAIPGDGTISSNWHTCLDAGCTSASFWKISGPNYGTPKALNLSENDLTIHPEYADQNGQILLINQLMSFLVEDQPVVIPTPFFSITITPTPTNLPVFTITPTPTPELITDPQPILTTTPSITPVSTITPIVPTTFPTAELTITPTISPEITIIPPVVPTEFPTLTLTPTPTIQIEEVAAEITTTSFDMASLDPTPTPQPEADRPLDETIEVTPEPTAEITPTIEITPTPEVVE